MEAMPEIAEDMSYLIRLNLGGYYSPVSKIPRVYNRCFPVPLTQWAIKNLRPNVSPEAWSVYTVLAYLEHLKFETKAPTMEELYDQYFGTSMSRHSFDLAIGELSNLAVDGVRLIMLSVTDKSKE